MTKKMLLVFLCFMLFLSIPCCKKKLPTSPDIPDIPGAIILPIINYFIATPLEIVVGSSSTLSWSVKDATTVEIDQGIGVVESEASIEVSPDGTLRNPTTYILTATNNDEQVSSSVTVTVVTPKAVLEITTIPEVPIFHYDDSTPYYEKSESSFTLIITETNGVGGHLNYISIQFPPDGYCSSSFPVIYHVDFAPFGSESYHFDVCARGRPNSMFFSSFGVDDNGHEIYDFYDGIEIPFTWDN